jgi:H+-transporting ATPase
MVAVRGHHLSGRSGLSGDAAATAKIAAVMIGISGRVWNTTPLQDSIRSEDYALFAGVLPED